jgi:hypothetical protein
MITRLIGIGLILTVLCTLCMGAIRARPYHENALTTLIRDDDACATYPAQACFMGILIGETRRAEVLDRLQAHPWVDEVFQTDFLITWSWSGDQPAAINAGQNGLVSFSSRTGEIAAQMRILTHIPYGDAWLALSSPDRTLLVRPFGRYSAFQIAFFDAQAMQVISALGCPVDPDEYWYSEISIGRGELWTTESINGVSFDIYDQPGWWRSLRRCRPLVSR